MGAKHESPQAKLSAGSDLFLTLSADPEEGKLHG